MVIQIQHQFQTTTFQIKLFVTAANNPDIMQQTVSQLPNNQINPELNLLNPQIIVKRHHKINLQILQLDLQIITCQILYVFVVMKRDILPLTAQILAIMVK